MIHILWQCDDKDEDDDDNNIVVKERDEMAMYKHKILYTIFSEILGDKEKKITPLTSRGIGIPMDIAVTAQGDLLVSDLELHCVWKVAKAGGKPTKLATLAGPRGVALDDKQHLGVVSRAKNPLQKILPDGTLETVVAKRPFQFPNDVIVDKNGVAFVTDSYQKCIWKVVPGQPPAQLSQLLRVRLKTLWPVQPIVVPIPSGCQPERP